MRGQAVLLQAVELLRPDSQQARGSAVGSDGDILACAWQGTGFYSVKYEFDSRNVLARSHLAYETVVPQHRGGSV